MSRKIYINIFFKNEHYKSFLNICKFTNFSMYLVFWVTNATAGAPNDRMFPNTPEVSQILFSVL